jgi:uncharacterized membrane protein
MQTSWRIELPQLLLILAMLIAGACTWPYVPDEVPVHWNIRGEVDRYGGRFEGLFIVPLVAAGLYVLLRMLPKVDPRAANYREFAGPYAIIRCALIAFMAVVHALLLLAALGRPIPIGPVVSGLVGILLIIIGALMSRIKPNWFVGVRTPWTLSSDLSWTKTHRLAARLLPLSGVAVMLAGFLRTEWAVYAMLPVLLWVRWQGWSCTLIWSGARIWRGAEPPRIDFSAFRAHREQPHRCRYGARQALEHRLPEAAAIQRGGWLVEAVNYRLFSCPKARPCSPRGTAGAPAYDS